jgi:acyl-homoserine-lactone acylase
VNLGRLAEAEGESALWQDLRQRLFIDSDTLQADFGKSPEWLRSLMSAWAAGLNCYLATHSQVRPRVITRFEPWMALSFSEGSIGGDVERVPLSQLEAFYGGKRLAMTLDERGLLFREPQGSNGFAIAPSHTKNGHALLLINPHTSFFFRSELQVTSSEGLNVYGAATWGQFFIYQGFNEHAGWMHTSSGTDNVDEFAETVITAAGGKHSYRYGKELRPVATKVVTLAYKAANGTLARRSFTTYATHHGPIVREADGKWIAFALMNKPVAALQQSFLRTKSSDYASFSPRGTAQGQLVEQHPVRRFERHRGLSASAVHADPQRPLRLSQSRRRQRSSDGLAWFARAGQPAPRRGASQRLGDERQQLAVDGCWC